MEFIMTAFKLVVLSVVLGAFSSQVCAVTSLLFDYSVDGEADYVEIPLSAALGLNISAFTISAFIYPEGWGQNDQGRIIDNGGGSLNEGWSFHLENKSAYGGIRLQVNNNSSFQGKSDQNVISLGIWQHVAITYNQGVVTFYIDGVLAGSSSNVPVPLVSTWPVRIGGRTNDMARGFDGNIDDVKVWAKALSQAEIQQSMSTQLTGLEPDLLAWYPVEENAGQLLFDQSSYANHGFLGNSAQADTNDPLWQQVIITNQPPLIDAGEDGVVVLAHPSIIMSPTVEDDGMQQSVPDITWSQVSGPLSAVIVDPDIASTQLIFSEVGIYTFELSADDGEYVSSDQVQVRVDASAIPTELIISPDVALIAPDNSMTFDVAVIDQAGNILDLSPFWSVTAGVIDQSGNYTSPSITGQYLVSASYNELNTQASIVVEEPGTVWPTTGWEPLAPSALGLNEGYLDQAELIDTAFNGNAFLSRGGYVARTWGDPSYVVDVKSVSKSIGVTLLGLALKDGLVSLNDKALDILPSFASEPIENLATGWIETIELRNLATHTGGFEKTGGLGALLYEPATNFYYSDGGANWLADVLTTAYSEDLELILEDRVLSVIGIADNEINWRDNYYRDRVLNGVTRREFASGISINAEAMAKIGYLYLREGVWDGQLVLGNDFVQAVSNVPSVLVGVDVPDPSKTPEGNNHYGLLWWNNSDGTIEGVPRDAYWAWGLGDGIILVIPSLDIVFARTGGAYRAGWTSDYSVVAPLFTAIVNAADGDLNGDNLPDNWAAVNRISDPYGDPDEDGVSSIDEFANGTNPNDSSPVITLSDDLSSKILGKYDSLSLSAIGADSEDGDLSDLIQWTSDRDGYLGEGDLSGLMLTEGAHTITAQLMDMEGAVVSEVFSLLVGEYERGDVNQDGKISMADLILIERHVLGIYPLSIEQRILADLYRARSGIDISDLYLMEIELLMHSY
jgi:CubicO group peptidase (beta-lactamase class C family)